jgi:hypothetical protein
MPAQKFRHIRFSQTEQRRGLGLSQALRFDPDGNAQDDIRLDGVFGNIGKADIREHVAAALCDSEFLFHSLPVELSTAARLFAPQLRQVQIIYWIWVSINIAVQFYFHQLSSVERANSGQSNS